MVGQTIVKVRNRGRLKMTNVFPSALKEDNPIGIKPKGFFSFSKFQSSEIFYIFRKSTKNDGKKETKFSIICVTIIV